MWPFYCFIVKRNHDVFKSKSLCIFLNKNIKIKQDLKWKISHKIWWGTNFCFNWYKNCISKVKIWWCDALELAKEIKGHFWNHLFCFKEILCFISVYRICFQNIHTVTYQKTLLYTIFACFENCRKSSVCH